MILATHSPSRFSALRTQYFPALCTLTTSPSDHIPCRDIHVKTDYIDGQSMHRKIRNVEIISQTQQLLTAVLYTLLEEICFSPRGV